MSAGRRSTFARMVELLTDQTVGQQPSPVPRNLQRYYRNTTQHDVTWEMFFGLKWVDDPSSDDLISGNKMMTHATMEIELSTFMAEGEAEDVDTEEHERASRHIADVYERVRRRLRDPSNMDTSVTGWLRAYRFRKASGPTSTDNMRLLYRFRFDVDIDEDMTWYGYTAGYPTGYTTGYAAGFR